MAQNKRPIINDNPTTSGPTSSPAAAIGIPSKNDDNAWKVVGSPSRRGSLMAMHMESLSPTAHSLSLNDDLGQRRPSSDAQTWGSFGGFQWEGSSIFDESNGNGVLSVPMLPSVPLEPVYRQHRSLSFSMGQDPTFFGYDDYDEVYKNPLETMTEEDDMGEFEEDEFEDELSRARLRERSKSSGAAFGLLSTSQRMLLLRQQLRRGSEQHEELSHSRRPSYLAEDYANMSLGDKEQIEILHQQQQQQQQRRLQSDYMFPDPGAYGGLYQRRPSQQLAPMQQLAEQFENTHLATPYLSQRPHHSSFPHHQIPEPNSHRQGHYDPSHSHHPNDPDASFKDFGKGVPLAHVPANASLFKVEFKAGRTDFYFAEKVVLKKDDLVLVEGDRGRDLGKVVQIGLTTAQIEEQVAQKQQQQQQHQHQHESAVDTADTSTSKRNVNVKRFLRLAVPEDIEQLRTKELDELHVLEVCQQKTALRHLPMKVVDAEYQWDRRKLTFYFEADRRIDFRDLVRELFKLYKTRIWMCAVNSQ